MLNKFSNLTELTCNLNLIPEPVAVDVMKRILDWVSSGEAIESDYVNKQLEYASKFIKGEVNS